MRRIGRNVALAALIATTLAVAPASALGAQTGNSIARRVASAPDGEVRMTYAARANACGDGRDVVGLGESFHIGRNVESYGRWSSNRECRHGAARVAVTLRDRQVVGIRPHIGGAWTSTEQRVTDLGQVPAADAAAYFMSLAPQFGSRSRPNPLLAAALADSVSLAPDMLRLARTAALPRETRRRALHWAGSLGDASTVAPLLEMARASDGATRTDDDDVGPGDGLRGAAVGALSMIPDGAGMPALMELARRGPSDTRRAAVFWLGQRSEPRGRELVRSIAADDRESEQLRGAAIFALGHGDATPDDRTFLRGLFPRLESERLKDRLLMGVAQSESPEDGRWLLAQARDERQPIEVRRKAVFWAGQGHARVADLTSLYGSARESQLREHDIFGLSQRDETGAVDALMKIARSDPNREMRKKALFWLAQKDDPRVTKLITDLVIR